MARLPDGIKVEVDGRDVTALLARDTSRETFRSHPIDSALDSISLIYVIFAEGGLRTVRITDEIDRAAITYLRRWEFMLEPPTEGVGERRFSRTPELQARAVLAHRLGSAIAARFVAERPSDWAALSDTEADVAVNAVGAAAEKAGTDDIAGLAAEAFDASLATAIFGPTLATAIVGVAHV